MSSRKYVIMHVCHHTSVSSFKWARNLWLSALFPWKSVLFWFLKILNHIDIFFFSTIYLWPLPVCANSYHHHHLSFKYCNMHCLNLPCLYNVYSLSHSDMIIPSYPSLCFIVLKNSDVKFFSYVLPMNTSYAIDFPIFQTILLEFTTTT